MVQRFELDGDYVSAHEVLRIIADRPMSAADRKDPDAVRAKVHALDTLGEYKWRYRVVDEGGSPREEAIAALEESRSLIEDFAEVSVRAGGDPESARRDWAPELADACQGLALARLVHNDEADRSEDKTIEGLLLDVLSLRESVRDQAKMAETLNSLGTLKQRDFGGAKFHFERSRILRDELGQADEAASAERAKALAQSLTSLGNLNVAIGDASTDVQEQAAYYQQALEQLNAAKAEYAKGFGSESHPKVAWAFEGIARVLQKRLRRARGRRVDRGRRDPAIDAREEWASSSSRVSSRRLRCSCS